MIYKLLVKVFDKSRNITYDEFGRKVIPVRWEEVRKINLGSMVKPNKKVIEIRFEPILLN